MNRAGSVYAWVWTTGGWRGPPGAGGVPTSTRFTVHSLPSTIVTRVPSDRQQFVYIINCLRCCDEHRTSLVILHLTCLSTRRRYARVGDPASSDGTRGERTHSQQSFAQSALDLDTPTSEIHIRRRAHARGAVG